MYEQRQDDQLEPTSSSSVPITDVAQKTCRIEKGGEKGSGISVLMARHDDDDDDDDDLDLARELRKLWNMRLTVISIVIGKLDTVPKT